MYEFEAYCESIKRMLGVEEKEETEDDSIKSLLRSAKERTSKIKFTGINLTTVKGLEDLLSSRGIGKLNFRNYDVDAILSQVMNAVKPDQN